MPAGADSEPDEAFDRHARPSVFPGGPRATAWVLEDSRQQALAIESALAPLLDVRLFHASPELLEALATAQPDVLILDWQVPEISGLEVLELVRARHDEVTLPTLIVTASHGAHTGSIEALAAGANDFSTKPFEAAELRARVSTLVRVGSLHARARRAERELGEALAREASARAEAEQQRQKAATSEERLRRVVEASGAGLWELDARTRSVDADERMRELMAFSKTAPMDWQSGFTGVHPDDAKRLAATVEGALRGDHQGAYLVEFRTGGRGGVPLRWIESRAQASFDATGTATRLSGAIVDITTRKEAELERETLLLREASARAEAQTSEAQLRLITDSIPLLVSFVTADERYGVVNKGYEDWFGLPAHSLVGRTVREVIGEAAYAILGPSVRRGLAGERFSFEQYDVPYSRGGPRDVRINFVPLTLAEGTSGGYVALLEDITARRHLEAERERLARERDEDYHRQSQFEQQLIGIVSHDLRTPLNVIGLSSGRLARDEQLNAAAIKNVVRIQNAADRAVRLVADLLDFTQARLGGGIRIERRKSDLHALIEALLTELETAHADRQIDYTHDGNSIGEWDPERISQLAQNLITNALKYSPPESIVEVSTRTDDGWTTLCVRNTGDIIPAEKLPSLFEPLQRGVDQVDRVTRSVGLGLYIVQKIAEAHGGSVRVESAETRGTAFTVLLPLVPPAS